MDGRLNAGLLAVGLLLVGCYMSHSAAADDDFSGDAIVDAHRSEDAGDRSILDGRYPQEDAWDLVACSDAACPDGMARIPCGPFVWGSRPGTGRTPAEEPAGVVWMPTYCIDQTETTVSQYFDCVASGVCAGIDLECNPDPWSSNPVRCVDSSQARRYCIWRGRFLSGSFRLASGGQWEKAARGGCEIVPPDDCGPEDERLYPWGDAPPTCDLANAAGCAGEVLPVGSLPDGASPYGVLDLAGNVAERVDLDDLEIMRDRTYCYCAPAPPPEICIDPGCSSGTAIRGGHFASLPDDLRVADRGPTDPDRPDEHVGFRCAYVPP